MLNQSCGYRSDYLTVERIRQAIEDMPQVIECLVGDCFVVTSYNWASKIHQDLWYLPMRTKLDALKYHIEDSLEQRIVVPGDTDFAVTIPDDRLTVLFCHESDIHLSGSDNTLINRIITLPEFSDIHFNSLPEIKNT